MPDPEHEDAAQGRADAAERASGEDAATAHEKTGGHVPADATERASGKVEDGALNGDG